MKGPRMRPVSPLNWVLLHIAIAWVGSGCAHSQRPAQKVYILSEDTSEIDSNPVIAMGGAGAEAYCNELEKQCFKKCWRRKPTNSSIKKGSAVHHEACTTTCREEFMQCIKKQEELERQESQKSELHFPSMDVALNWLREHETEVAIGAVVIVGGVVATPYIIAVMGGALVLAPL